jgi:hypothetical protein
MIAWIVSTNGILTGLTSESSSYSWTVDFGNTVTAENGGSTYFNTGSASGSSYSFSSQNSSGTTSSFHSEFFGDESASTSESATFLDGTSTITVEGSDRFSETVGGITSDSSSGLLTTMQSQTSTTETYVANKTESTQRTSIVSFWTTSQNQSTDPVLFYPETTTANVYSSTLTTEQLVRDATTTISGTMVSSATAFVVQANTSGFDAEIIHYLSSTHSWDGLSAASAVANTATRATLSNLYLTTEAPKIFVNVAFDTDGGAYDVGIPSFSWSNEINYSTQLTTSTATILPLTTVVDSTILPNETATTEGVAKTTTSLSLSANLWSGNSGECSEQSKTTTAIVNVATSSAAAGSSWFGSLSWNAIRTGIATLAATTSTEAAYERNMSQTGSVSTYAEGRASGFTVEKNIALVIPPQPTTAMVQNVRQSKFVPAFAQISTSSGQWFVVERSTFSSASFVRLSRSEGKTAFPKTQDGESYGLSALTYSVESGTSTTTSTASLGVSGGSTTTMLLNAVGLAGGSPNISEFFAYGVSTAGVFKNRIDGQTTTLDVGATTFSESQSLSFFEPITGLVPVAGIGSTALFPVFWAVPRNSTALPPTMPPNA